MQNLTRRLSDDYLDLDLLDERAREVLACCARTRSCCARAGIARLSVMRYTDSLKR